MKKVLKYVIVFFLLILVLFSLLVATAKIPRNLIEENIKKSSDIFWKYASEDNSKTPYNQKHFYADAMILYIIYYIDSNNIVDSVMEANYFSLTQDEAISFDISSIVNNIEKPNTQYIRYWHGSMTILRPLLIFFDISQIYIINLIILAVLLTVLIIKLRKIKELVLALLLGLIMCAIWTVPFCVEYTWTFLIMLISSIILVNLEKKGKDIKLLFFITGIITCYLDFLTTEIITLFVPLIILLTIRYKNNKISNIKESIKMILCSIILWTIGYVGMWFAKWILASVILKINAFDYVIEYAKKRINGTEFVPQNYILETIPRNFKTLFPINFLLNEGYFYFIVGILIIYEIIFIRKKEFKKLWFSFILLLISLSPYIRYLVLANHSYLHSFFTFRSQIITIVAITLAVIYSWDKKILSYKIGKVK